MIDDILHHLCTDKKLAKVIDRVGKYNMRHIRNRYECLVGAIINQQLSGSAARSIQTRFRALYPGRFPLPSEVMSTSISTLRRIGLSSMKTSYIKDISVAIDSKRLRLDSFTKMDDESIIDVLVSVRGIGRWTAQMYLMFALARQDVLPTSDLGLRTGVQRLYLLKSQLTDERLERIAQKWRPYRSIATWYIWRGMQGFGEI